MPWVEIRTQRHKNAYAFTRDTWRHTHSPTEIEAETIYPFFFSGTLETYQNPLYRFIWENRFLAPRLQSVQLQQSTYEQRLRPTLASPLYPLTISAIQYLTSYATTREQSSFRRDPTISHPRNQIIVYLCTTLCELESKQLNAELIGLYQKEFQFIGLILQNAHVFFPTSSLYHGRRGFHALLMNVQDCIRPLQDIVRTQLERETLKEHIGNLLRLTHALRVDTTRFIAHSFNSALSEPFNFHYFYHSPDADAFLNYRKSGIGQWMFLLFECQKNNSSNNPWLENPEVFVQALITYPSPGIPTPFLNQLPLMITFCQLHGLALEIQHLENLLTRLEEAAGLSGDYSITHNQTLFNALMHCILCIEKLGEHAAQLTKKLAQAQESEIRKAPAKNPPWVAHYRASLSIQSSIMDNISQQTPGVICKTKASTEKLKQLGYGEYQQKLKQVVEHTNCFVERLGRFNLLPHCALEEIERDAHEPPPAENTEERHPLITAIQQVIFSIELDSEQNIQNTLEQLQKMLLQHNWKVVRHAGLGGSPLRFNGETYILPKHIHAMLRVMNQALSKQSGFFEAYCEIVSIAKKACLRHPGPFGLFRSWRDPMAQATYELLGSSHVPHASTYSPIISASYFST